ncbi:Uncharacterised protein [Streptococcus equi subsp. zooepidemicus]|nr:Uncharacterised protein [Streptococcus equi subsp. zooepidemicus]
MQVLLGGQAYQAFFWGPIWVYPGGLGFPTSCFGFYFSASSKGEARGKPLITEEELLLLETASGKQGDR